MVEHFHEHVRHRIGGKAKAMIVTRSRLHAVRYGLALKSYLKERELDYGVLVAFSGTVRDPDSGLEYTEGQMNGVPDSQTKQAFERPDNRFLVVANKFQTGFDQPLLHTMYVDKKLGGVNAVQTLSRLNRTHPDKEECMVLDFANEAGAIQASFEDYYETTILSEGTDPAVLDDLQHRIEEFHLFSDEEVEEFLEAYFRGEEEQAELYAILKAVRKRFEDGLDEDEQEVFRGTLKEFVRTYAFLSQILPYQDEELERLYTFGRYLSRYILPERGTPVTDLQDQIEMEAYGVRKVESGIALTGGNGILDPTAEKGVGPRPEDEEDRLSAIIKELNDRYGAGLTEEDRISLAHLESRLVEDSALRAAVRSNTKGNVELTFEQKVNDYLQDMADSNFKLYKRINDDESFGKALLGMLFEGFWAGAEKERGGQGELDV